MCGFSFPVKHLFLPSPSFARTHTPCYSLMLCPNSVLRVSPAHGAVTDQFCCWEAGNWSRQTEARQQSMEKNSDRDLFRPFDLVNICQMSRPLIEGKNALVCVTKRWLHVWSRVIAREEKKGGWANNNNRNGNANRELLKKLFNL